MNESPVEELVNGKKKKVRQILSVEEFNTQHIRIYIHRILIIISFIAVSQPHQMKNQRKPHDVQPMQSFVEGVEVFCKKRNPMKIGPRQCELFEFAFGVIAGP